MLAGFLCFFRCALFGTRTNQSTIQFSCEGSRTRRLSVLPSCRGRLWVCQWSLTLLCMPGSALWHYCCRYGCQWEKRECQAVRHFTTVKAKGAEYDTCEYRESVTAAHSVGFLYCMYISWTSSPRSVRAQRQEERGKNVRETDGVYRMKCKMSCAKKINWWLSRYA